MTYTAYSKRSEVDITFEAEPCPSAEMWELFPADTTIFCEENGEVLDILRLDELFNNPNN